MIISIAYPSEDDSSKVYMRYPGSKALEFRMYSVFSLSALTGGNISYKSFRNEKKAIRIGLNFYGNADWKSGKYKEVELDYSIDSTEFDTTSYIRDINQNYIDFSLGLQFIKYSKPKIGISLCYGFGPLIGYRSNLNNNKDSGLKTKLPNEYDHIITDYKSIDEKYYGGITTMIGVEWFFHKSVSFHAEYHNDLMIGKSYYHYLTERQYYNGEYEKEDYKTYGNYLEFTRKVFSGIDTWIDMVYTFRI